MSDNDRFEITHRINEDAMTVAQLVIERDKYKSRAERYEKALNAVIHELGVPQPGYPAPIANAYEVAKEALEGKEREDDK